MTLESGSIEQLQLEATGKAIREVTDLFRSSPGSFLYESDLRGLLYSRMFDALQVAPIRWSAPGDVWNEVRGTGALVINPARTEYPSRLRFDVAVLPPDPHAEKNAWCQPVRIAIELKLRQADWTGHAYHGDLDKLRNYAIERAAVQQPFTGICLVFCHRSQDEALKQWLEDQSDTTPLLKNPSSLDVPANGIVAWAITPLNQG